MSLTSDPTGQLRNALTVKCHIAPWTDPKARKYCAGLLGSICGDLCLAEHAWIHLLLELITWPMALQKLQSTTTRPYWRRQ